MKVDLTKTVMTFQKDEALKNEKGLPVTFAKALIPQLLDSQDKLSGEQKWERYKLAVKLESAKPDEEFSVEELKCLKDTVGQKGSPLFLGQFYELLGEK